MSLEPYVISQRRPFRQVLLTLVIVVLALAVQWFFNHKRTQQDEQQLQILQSKQQQLSDSNKQLKQENARLSSALRENQQQLAMQVATDQQLQQQLADLQSNILDLNRELTFYQTITQINGSSSLQVRELKLTSVANQPDNFSYRLVITQGKKINNAIEGEITIAISNKKSKNSSQTLAQHALHLRHVQVVDGMLKLTAQHRPDTITVTLSHNKKVLTSRSFDWQVDKPPTQ